MYADGPSGAVVAGRYDHSLLKRNIIRQLRRRSIQLAREQHMSIIFISSEIDEMTRTCTRLAVLRDRRKVAELTGDDINSDRVMAAIAGGA